MSLIVKCSDNYETASKEFFHTHYIYTDFVSDGLVDFIDDWETRNPVLIDAATGAGKNTFVKNVCMKKAIEKNKNCLLVSNRIAASSQQKKIIAKEYCPNLLQELTDVGLVKNEDFGNIKIVTYQSLYSFLKKAENIEWKKKLLYVIFDECHFFTSDCMFNENCEFILNEIVRRFSNNIRIYMTATPFDVEYPITNAEKNEYFSREKFVPNYLARSGIKYSFPRNYKYLNVNFINSTNELISLIKKSQNQKWLIFIDNKDKGKALANEFSDNCSYLDAEQKNSEEWKNIINTEQFEKQILITTSVLDNGVNIKDTALKNIAIFTDDRTKLIQMIGRKRCDKDETVNLWLCDMTTKAAQRKLNNLYRLFKWYELYENCHYESDRKKLMRKLWKETDSQARRLFYIGNSLKENALVKYFLLSKIKFYESIVNGETTFQNEVLKWLGKTTKEKIEYKEKLLEFCQIHLGTYLSAADKDDLRFLIINTCEEQGFSEPQKHRINMLKHTALNNRFIKLEIEYHIINNEQGWILSKAENVEL